MNCLAKGITAVAAVLTVTGCVTTQTALRAPLVSDATTLVGTPSVSSWGRNWKISWTAESKGERFEIYTAATDCEDRSGVLFVDGPTGRFEPTRRVILGGPKAEDRLFTRLCSTGYALANTANRNQPRQAANDSQMSPQSRAVLMQHLLNQAMPPQTPATETRCQRVPYSTTGEVVCNTK